MAKQSKIAKNIHRQKLVERYSDRSNHSKIEE